jgi:predicted negative regulator of RcsB-dependent stress response
MNLPMTFQQFLKDPIKGLFFMVILAVGYLYIDNRLNYTSQIDKCEEMTIQLTKKVEILEEKLRKSDSTLARAAAKLEIINELEGIK